MNILCYGDSNTWGYIPNINGYSKDAIMTHYPTQDCWWHTLMQDNQIFLDGLCGRCIAHENRWLKNRNASKTIDKDLENYPTIDLIIVQLGTNDCKSEYDDSAETITENMEKLLQQIKTLINAEIMIISPAKIREDNKITKKYYIGAEEKSEHLDQLYRELASNNNYYFVSGKDLEIGEDGEHLTKRGHADLGNSVAKIVRTLNHEFDM